MLPPPTQHFSNYQLSSSVVWTYFQETLESLYWVVFQNTGLNYVLLAGFLAFLTVNVWNKIASKL